MFRIKGTSTVNLEGRHSHIFMLWWPSCGMNSSDEKGFHVAYPVSINSVLVRSDGHSFTSRKLSVCRIELEVNCKTCTQDIGDTLWEPLKTGKLKGDDKKNHRLPRSKSNEPITVVSTRSVLCCNPIHCDTEIHVFEKLDSWSSLSKFLNSAIF